MEFAPASTVMAHYTRANVGVAIDWIKLADQIGHAGQGIETVGAVGFV